MKNYTLGFIFNTTMDKVLLINKLAPDWQVGLRNGLGGKVEEGEDSVSCMVREVEEESSLQTKKEDWSFVGTIGSVSWKVDIFGLKYLGNMEDAKSMEKEQVEWCDVHNISEKCVENLSWLIPLTIDKMKNNRIKHSSVEYN